VAEAGQLQLAQVRTSKTLADVSRIASIIGPSTVASRKIATSAAAHASTQGAGRIPQARRENGENMSPKEWADQLRNVREWKARQEAMREFRDTKNYS